MPTSRQTARRPPTHLPKRLIFIRHAIAIAAEEFAGADADRPLTADGIKRAKACFAQILAKEKVDRIISSPYLRAVNTAELVQAHAAKSKVLELSEALTPDTHWERWKKAVVSGGFDFAPDECVVLVGHEPSLGMLFAGHLGHARAIPFKKAGIGILEPDGWSGAQLIAFIAPRYVR